MCWLRVYAWLRVKNKVKGTSVCIVMWCKLDHRTRQFLMCWLRVYAWLRVKNKVKDTSVRIVMWCKLDHRTRQYLMCWLRVYAQPRSQGLSSLPPLSLRKDPG